MTSAIPRFRLNTGPRILVAAFAVAILLATGAIALFRQDPSPKRSIQARSVYGARLGLYASRMPEGIHVVWNKDSDYVRYAEKGTLRIIDGSMNTAVELNTSQLRYGQYFLTPYSDQVALSLDILTDSRQHVQESTRAVPVVPEAERARQATPPPETVTSRPIAPRQEVHAAAMLTQAPKSSGRSQNLHPNPSRLAVSLPAPSLNALKTLEPLPVETGPAQQPAASLPPVSGAPSQQPPVRREVLPEASTPAPKLPVQVAPPQNDQGTVSPFTPPALVSQSPIALPEILKAAVRNKNIEIHVIANVDANGRVSSIRSRDPLSGLPENLFSVARLSVMNWRFRPAKLGDRAVAGEFGINLKFGSR